MAELDWGRRYLMCRPTYFGVNYEINPWMKREVTVDVDVAQQQWDNLVANLRSAGADVEIMEGADGWPDLVFTANAGIVNGRQFVPSLFKYPERQGETPFNIEYFASTPRADGTGWAIDHLPERTVHEGAGDALPFGNGANKVLMSGFGWRTEAESIGFMAQLTGAAVRAVKLVDPRMYHIDLAFCPLDDQHALVAETAFDGYGAKTILNTVPEPLVLSEDEALTFCSNSVVVGKNIVMPACPPRIGNQLEAWGFNVIESKVTEFMKGGGGCRCLTLALDQKLGTYSPD